MPVFDPTRGPRNLPESLPVGVPDEWIDWRQEDLRDELFLTYYEARRKSGDLDHTLYYTRVANDHDLDFEQRAWFSFLFGMTYKVPQAHAYLQAFPDFHAIDLNEVEEWNTANWKKTVYGTDARWNKGHFASQVRSMKEWLNGATFEEKIGETLRHDTVDANFEQLFGDICGRRQGEGLFKWGRMTTWLTLQGLYDMLDLPINARTIMVETGGNWSGYNGAVFLMNRPDLLFKKTRATKPTEESLLMAAEEVERIWKLAEARFPQWEIDCYRLETCLCQYKKLFTGWEYIGHASGDAAQSLMKVEGQFPELRFDSLRRASLSQPERIGARPRVKALNTIFLRYGVLLNEDLSGRGEDGYKALGIDIPDRIFEGVQ